MTTPKWRSPWSLNFYLEINICIAKTTIKIVVVTFQSSAVDSEEDPAINEVDFVDDMPNEKKVSVNRSIWRYYKAAIVQSKIQFYKGVLSSNL